MTPFFHPVRSGLCYFVYDITLQVKKVTNFTRVAMFSHEAEAKTSIRDTFSRVMYNIFPTTSNDKILGLNSVLVNHTIDKLIQTAP